MFIIDSHCHLNFPDFKEDLPQILARAEQNHIKLMLNICTNLNEFSEVLNIANSYDNIYATVGVHPCHVADHEEVTFEQLLKLCNEHQKVIGIGETGLDYYHQPFCKAKQHRNFLTHIKLAQETNLPIIIHTRDAEEDTIKILAEQLKIKSFKFIIHCFTGTDYLRDQVLALGGYISISGIVTFKNAIALQNTVKLIPIERMLVETDAPYLAPVPMRGKRNEPAFTLYTLEFLSHLLNIDKEELAAITTANFRSLFKL